jgi:hypothetical protein
LNPLRSVSSPARYFLDPSISLVSPAHSAVVWFNIISDRGPLRVLPKPATGLHPATRLLGDSEHEASWERGLAAMCGRCWKALLDAGGVGRKLKGTEERWWLGHDVGTSPNASKSAADERPFRRIGAVSPS